MGILEVEEALRAAEEAGLDLVEISPVAEPPVCRLMDYGKFLFEENKRRAAAKKKQQQIQVKEVKFRPGIDQHDYQVKMRNMVRFLEEGDKVKVTIQFRGREMARTDRGRTLVERVAGDVAELGVLESSPEMAGRRMHAVFGPARKKK